MFLCQRFDSRERSLLPHVLPVLVEFCFMAACPLLDEILGSSRLNVSFEQLAVEIECCVLSLVFRMEMRRVMVPVEHANYYTKEYAYGWHTQRARERGIRSYGVKLAGELVTLAVSACEPPQLNSSRHTVGATTGRPNCFAYCARHKFLCSEQALRLISLPFAYVTLVRFVVKFL